MNIEGLLPSIPASRRIGEPKRKISLDAETEEAVEQAIATLKHAGFETSAIFGLFEGWNSKQTIAARRVLLTLGVLVGGSHWVRVDLSQASIWGMSLGQASLARFLALAGVILVVGATMYLISRRLDHRVQTAKVMSVADSIEPCREAARVLERVVEANHLSSVTTLIDDFTGLMFTPVRTKPITR
jgi:hypothetical protein